MSVVAIKRTVYVAERRVCSKFVYDPECGSGYEDCEPFVRRKTFATERAAWRHVVWGYVFTARWQKECTSDEKCPLCDPEIINPRVYALADRLMSRARRRRSAGGQMEDE